ncbi:hypothetical protein G9A89_001293 [Geosiphon pyriformis]|nr:hypothetical protein G9A89_001293 [Geosiphon pyriformis]
MGTTAHDLSDLVQSYAYCAVICFDTKVARKTAIYSIPVFKSVNLVWASLSSSKCVICSNFDHVSSKCGSDKRCLVLIYAKKQALMFCPVSFGDTTWASVNNLSIGSVDSLMLAIMILVSHVSVFKHLLKNVSDQVADISHKLNRLLAVLSASFIVPSTPEHNPVLNMAVDTLLFILPMPSVVTAVSQNIFLSGSCVLTVKIGGLEANLAVLENSVKVILNKLDFFGFGSGMDNIIRWHTVLNNDILIVTETKLHFSLDAGFLDAGITLIMNENLAKHVSKISEIPSRLLMVCLLFKNKQFVSVLDLYVEASLDKCIIQAGLINFFIAKACNKSTFVILGGDFNEDGNKCSSSFNKCMDLSLVNALRTIDYIFVLQSLSNALVNRHVVDVDEFFSTDHSSKQYRTVFYDNFIMFSDEFTDSHHFIVCKAICFSVNEVFLKTWSKNFDSGFTKCFSHYYRLKLLVSKLVKALCSVSSNEFVFLLDVWVSLDSVNAFVIKSFFLLRSYFDAIRSALAKVRKSYHFLKMIELLVIDKRMKNFELNKGQTIRSVLEQPFCKVILNHLIVNEDLILEPGLVKFYVDRIMEGWTRKHVVVDNVSDKWHCQFQPLEYVFDDVFSNVMYPIKVKKFLGVVLSLPIVIIDLINDLTIDLVVDHFQQIYNGASCEVVKIHFVSYCIGNYSYLPQQSKEHFKAHNKNNLDIIELNLLPFCLICFFIEKQSSRQFQDFWNWFLNEHSAETYTSYTIYYFD